MCSVLGYGHLTTFDGNEYNVLGAECWYTLVEVMHFKARKQKLYLYFLFHSQYFVFAVDHTMAHMD